jgi:CAAX protease family protein
MDQALMHLAGIALGGYFLWMWIGDYRAASGGHPAKTALAGAVPCRRAILVVAVVGALVILALEVGGEYGLAAAGLANIDDQSDMTVLFGVYTLMAAFIEELIFRGYLYYDRGSRAMLLASVVGVSILFTLGHPYIWDWQWPESAAWWQVWRLPEARLSLDPRPLAVFSTTIVFVRSLWFFAVRFAPQNPSRSLLPPIAAHLATNAGVFAVKAMQGQVVGWF